MIILDSDILVAYLRDNREAVDKIAKLMESKIETKTTVLNAQELLIGVAEEEIFEKTVDFVKQLGPIYYSLDCTLKTIEIARDLRRAGASIGAIDEMIAGTCKAYNATLLTRNIQHFKRVKGLKVEKW